MLDKFNGIIYLSIFILHFIVYAVYAFRTVVATKSFLDQYNIDHSAAVMVRFFGAPFLRPEQMIEEFSSPSLNNLKD